MTSFVRDLRSAIQPVRAGGMRRILAALLVLLLLVGTVPGCAPGIEAQAQAAIDSPHSPCKDLDLLALQRRPVEQLTEREFELLKVKEEACQQHKSNAVAAAHIAKGAAHQGDVMIAFFLVGLGSAVVLAAAMSNR